MREIKFNLITYKPIRVYSSKYGTYFTAKKTAHIDRIGPTLAAPAENLTIEEILKILPKDVEKAKRSCIQMMDIDTFALKEYTPIDRWNGCIFIDLDIYKSHIFDGQPNVSKHLQTLYDEVTIKLCDMNECFYYAERSSSGGFHFIFNYKVDPTQENFDKCAQYTKKIIYEAGDMYKEWKDILNDEGVFDPVYMRPYQRAYITGIDAMLNYNHTGDILQCELDAIYVRDRKHEAENNKKNTYELATFEPKGEYETDHNKRFYIYTALKRVTPDEKTCNDYYWRLCEHFKLYKSYTIKDFKKEFNYAQIDESTAYVPILKKYGIKINTNILHYHIGEDGYLSDVIDDILEQAQVGINMIKAGTGVGKNQTWISYNKKKLADPLSANDKPILIIEPLNSIIETKYDDDVSVVTGSKTFPRKITGYGMWITNYNKVLSKTQDGWKMMDNAKEWFSQFEMVIIDESHIIIKDSFRADVLTEFVKTIQAASKSTKIIMQTATEMDERELFDIDKTFIIHKPVKRKSKFIFRRFNQTQTPKFKIQEVVCLCNYYIRQNRKVYIYWNNASLQILNSFKETYEKPERVAIFHKRNTGSEDMQYISENHELGDKYDILLTSVYFGVGNDLNDKCDAAVIIIGNNTWQEDLQVIGRWRNSPNVEICEIITDDREYEFIESTATFTNNRRIELQKWYNYYRNIWNDKHRRDKSVMINKKSYMMKSVEDIYILAVMTSSDIYHSGFNVKINNLSDTYYSIRMKTDYTRPLECNYEYVDAVKEFNKKIKEVRDKEKANIMAGTPNWDVVNKDTKLDKFAHLWGKLKLYGVDKILDPRIIALSSNYNMLDTWVRYYRTIMSGNTDLPEIYALMWFRDKLKNKTSKELKTMSETMMEFVDGADSYEFSELDQYIIYAYIIWLWYRNNNDDKRPILGNYYSNFKFNCINFLNMPDELIEKMNEQIYNVDPHIQDKYTETNEFFGEILETSTVIEEIKSWVDVKKLIICVDNHLKEKENIYYAILKALKHKNGGRPTGSKGSKRKVIIAGVEYANSKEAQEKLGKSAAWVTKYKQK